MTDLNIQIVREFFELQLFHVLSYWQHEDLQQRISDATPLLFVEHFRAETRPDLDFLLRPGDCAGLGRAMVEVRAWHADRFYSSVIESSNVLSHVVGQEARALADSVFGGEPYATILVISELPQGAKQRDRSLLLLRDMGIDHIIEFPSILQEILSRLSAHANYAPSQTLQTLRLLKRYNFIRRQQLEFSFPIEAPPSLVPPVVDAQLVAEESEDGE